jgi:hypothetical protein
MDAYDGSSNLKKILPILSSTVEAENFSDHPRNIEVAYMHKRLTANGFLKYCSKQGDS